MAVKFPPLQSKSNKRAKLLTQFHWSLAPNEMTSIWFCPKSFSKPHFPGWNLPINEVYLIPTRPKVSVKRVKSPSWGSVSVWISFSRRPLLGFQDHMGRKLSQVENINANLFCWCGEELQWCWQLKYFTIVHIIWEVVQKYPKIHTHIQYISKPLRGFHKNIIRGTQNNLQFLWALVDMQWEGKRNENVGL